MRPFLCLVPFALMACQPIGAPAPGVRAIPEGEVGVIGVRASPSQVTIRLSDGSVCEGVRPEDEPGGWSGVTGDCPYALPYTVTFRQGGVPQRYVIEAPQLPVGPDGVPGPRAEVFVTEPDGVRRLFMSPLDRNVRFGPPPGEADPTG